jgi:hypothetical protein
MIDEEIEKKDIFDNSELETIEPDITTEKTTETILDTVVEPETETTDDISTEEVTEPEIDEFDYKTAYKNLLKFKADGQDIELNDVNELVSLAQKGVNYTRKTKEISQYNKYIKTLKDNELLDDDKINFLIDLHKGDKQAITKHLKELNVNPVELDTDSETTYKSKSYVPDDVTIQKQSYVENLYSDPDGKAVIDDINNWDDISINSIAENVAQLADLTQHKKLGYYDIIIKEIHRQELLGNLSNIPYLDAYASIGKQLVEQGKLGNVTPNPQPQKVVDVKKAVTDIKLNQTNIQKLSPLSGKTTSKQELDPGSMNDEEFVKYMKTKYKF